MLAGGFGTRLLEAVSDVPKAMAPINGVPLLKLQLDNWIHQGQKSFLFLLHHKADSIISLLEEQKRAYGTKINIDWIVEKRALGTGGSVANAVQSRDLSSSIMVANADTWLESGLELIRAAHKPVVGVVKVEDKSRYGCVDFDDQGYVMKFVEKSGDQCAKSSGIINAGIYKLPIDVFKGKASEVFSLEVEVLPLLVRAEQLTAIELPSIFFDIGVPADYFDFCYWHKRKNLKE